MARPGRVLLAIQEAVVTGVMMVLGSINPTPVVRRLMLLAQLALTIIVIGASRSHNSYCRKLQFLVTQETVLTDATMGLGSIISNSCSVHYLFFLHSKYLLVIVYRS